MSIFDNLKKAAGGAAKAAVKAAAAAAKEEKQTFTFAVLPESVDELKALPEAALASPFQTAALTVCALCAYAADPEIGIEMLNSSASFGIRQAVSQRPLRRGKAHSFLIF